MRAHQDINQMKPGMMVTVDHHKVAGLTGRIVKINRSKVKVNFESKGIYNVPKTMIEVA